MLKNQKGITLVEILIATAISGLIFSVLGAAIYQFVGVTESGSNEMTALNEVQNAAHWVNIDGQMASMASGSSELALTMPDDSTITYALSGTELRRTSTGSQITVARNINSISFSVDERVITMIITSSPEGRWGISEERTFKVYLRSTS